MLRHATPRAAPLRAAPAALRRAFSWRTESDTMGDVQVPANALYGASTQRAVHNFRVSGLRMPRRFLRALGQIKAAAARANGRLGLLPAHHADAIAAAAERVASGALDEHFPVDVFQTGSGTSSNMNGASPSAASNEVIANVANRALGAPRLGTRSPVHPNDHVNLGQSSNDVVPSAAHLAAATSIHEALLPALGALEAALRSTSARTWGVLKPGRTHLQDALPLRMGHVFRGHADEVAAAIAALERAMRDDACVLALGGTAVGTGFGARRGFAAAVLDDLRRCTGLPLRETAAHFTAQAAMDGLLRVSAALNSAAATAARCANSLRWLACGPRAGLGELTLLAVQPGSSIMPGKVNPVLAESLLAVSWHVGGGHAAMTLAAREGAAFELHTGWPLAVHTLVTSAEWLGAAAAAFASHVVAGAAPTERGPQLAQRSLMCATGLLPLVGYDRAAAVAKAAAEQGSSVAEAAAELCGDVDVGALRRAVHPSALLGPRDTPEPPA